MIRINLLPFRNTRQKENIKQQVSIFLLFLILLTIPLFWYSSRLDGKIETLEGEIVYTKKDIAKYKELALESEALKNKIAVLNTKLKIIDNLEKSQKTAFRLMDTMTGMVVEKKMWFNRLEALEKAVRVPTPETSRGKKKKGEKENVPTVHRPQIDVNIDGIALDNQTVADFMTRLEDSEVFSDIRLINLKQETLKQGKNQEDINLRDFQVYCKGTTEKSEAKKNHHE